MSVTQGAVEVKAQIFKLHWFNTYIPPYSPQPRTEWYPCICPSMGLNDSMIRGFCEVHSLILKFHTTPTSLNWNVTVTLGIKSLALSKILDSTMTSTLSDVAEVIPLIEANREKYLMHDTIRTPCHHGSNTATSVYGLTSATVVGAQQRHAPLSQPLWSHSPQLQPPAPQLHLAVPQTLLPQWAQSSIL